MRSDDPSPRVCIGIHPTDVPYPPSSMRDCLYEHALDRGYIASASSVSAWAKAWCLLTQAEASLSHIRKHLPAHTYEHAPRRYVLLQARSLCVLEATLTPGCGGCATHPSPPTTRDARRPLSRQGPPRRKAPQYTPRVTIYGGSISRMTMNPVILSVWR